MAVNMIARLLGRIQRKGLSDTVGLAWCVAAGTLDYWLNPFAKRQNRIPKQNYEEIRADMEQAGLDVASCRVDVERFHAWLERAHFPQDYVDVYERYGKGVFLEKALEHYLGAELLGLGPDDVLIDVAAANSPWLDIAERLYGCTAYALDLAYPPGIHGKQIGADATAMPLEDGFATKMALHCAYEMFEGDADSRLIPEAARVLRRGGRMVILPLYMHHLYYADSSPWADRRGVDYQGAVRVWRERDVVRFSRKYDVPAFMERVVPHKGPLRLTIRYIENEKEVDPACYLKFAAVFDRA